MLKAALFSDGTKEYRIPEEPECGEQVTIRFRTGAGDVDHVYAVVRDAVSREEGRRLELKKKESIGRLISMRQRFRWGRPRCDMILRR